MAFDLTASGIDKTQSPLRPLDEELDTIDVSLSPGDMTISADSQGSDQTIDQIGQATPTESRTRRSHGVTEDSEYFYVGDSEPTIAERLPEVEKVVDERPKASEPTTAQTQTAAQTATPTIPSELSYTVPTIPAGYKDKLSEINETKAWINSRYARETAKIIATVPARYQAVELSRLKMYRDNAIAEVGSRETALGGEFYAKLDTPTKIRADQISQQTGITTAEAAKLAAEDDYVRRRASTILNQVVNDPQLYNALETKLLGRKQFDSMGKEQVENGRPARVGGILQRDPNLGIMRVVDPDAFESVHDMVVKGTGGTGTRSGGKAEKTPNQVRIETLKTTRDDLDKLIEDAGGGEGSDEEKARLLGKKRLINTELEDRLELEIQQGGVGNAGPNQDPQAWVRQSRAAKDKQNQKVSYSSAVDEELKKRTQGMNDMRANMERSKIQKEVAQKRGIPVIQASGDRAVSEYWEKPAGTYLLEDPKTGETEILEWPGKDAVARSIVGRADIGTLDTEIAKLKSEMDAFAEKKPHVLGSLEPEAPKRRQIPAGEGDPVSAGINLFKDIKGKIYGEDEDLALEDRKKRNKDRMIYKTLQKKLDEKNRAIELLSLSRQHLTKASQ